MSRCRPSPPWLAAWDVPVAAERRSGARVAGTVAPAGPPCQRARPVPGALVGAVAGVARARSAGVGPAGRPPRSRMLALMDTIRVALAQLAPSLGELDRNLRPASRAPRAGAGGRGGPGRLPGARTDRLPAPGPRGRGLAPARRPATGRSCGRDRGPFRDRLVRRGVSRPPAVHRGGAARGRGDPARPPQAVPADLRPLRRTPLLRGGRHAAGGAVAPGGRPRDRDLRGLLAPDGPADPRAGRRADPHQRLVVARARPGGHERGRAWARRRRGGR